MKKAVFILSVFTLGGCAHVTPVVSSMDYNPETMEAVGFGTGESSQGYLFCLIPTGPAYSVTTAIKSVLYRSGAHAMINTVAEHEVLWIPPLFCEKTIRVSGTLVKLKKSPGAEDLARIENLGPYEYLSTLSKEDIYKEFQGMPKPHQGLVKVEAQRKVSRCVQATNMPGKVILNEDVIHSPEEEKLLEVLCDKGVIR
jgi:hypothetical protein